ncbi:SusC/RagA family TonB-linked outer membrane protein [Chitinophaga sp. GCM10012297]|uniref:SusC/RagA family TonB-linked outer membrane protein n=1 Tax=Chitinophaga chungangae TaxID=2821488 RepID=A0ABS3YKB0_9BACT|nr:SusC/RagA family TonB-linked outer membrane protein [Chitinophaga chungangae]MBO9155127.1 SusC/RagA family TonB-linked outer membrane protein [Chitinophaga chungangae]
MKRFYLLSLACMMSMGAMAQQVIRGTVRDSLTKAPIPGATIRVVNGSGGVTANEKGEFELRVPANAQLRISSIGFETVLIPATAVIKPIMLTTTALLLNTPVVVGYGTQQRKNLTTSISSISSKKLAPENNIVSDVGKALQGRVAGVFVANTSGSPGNTPNIQIRGVQSARAADANPLIVIDGLVMEGNGISLNSINPQDIETIDVLKDAASAAIYGARGSTGVIIITTKKGRQGTKPSFSVNAYTGFNNVPSTRRMLNSQEYESVFKDARNNRLADIGIQLTDPSLTPVQISQLQAERTRLTSQASALKMENRSIDWIDRVKNKRAPVNNIQASMTGGGEKNSYYMSIGRYSETASIGTGQFERYTGKIDLTQQVGTWLKLNGNINLSQGVNKNNAYPLVSAFNARPDTPEEPIRLPNGQLDYYIGQQNHPLGEMLENNNKRRTQTWFGNLSADVTLHRTLQFRSVFSANKYNVNGNDYQSPLGYLGKFNKGYLKVSGADNLNYNFDNYLTYNNRFKQLGVNAVAGYTYYSVQQSSFGYDLNGFPAVAGISGGSAAASYGSAGSISSLNGTSLETSEAWFGRVNLDWDQKYLLGASLRTDGSSKLHPENRYSWFPSVSAGWDVAKENFMLKQKMISFLKLRASYGISGNIRPLANFAAEDLMSGTSYLGEAALKLRDLIGNPSVRWEQTKQADAGIDLGLFNQRVNLTVDYYNKTTDGLLSNRFIPWEFGAQSIPYNVGSIRNYGMDVELSVGSRQNAKVMWRVETNMNFNRNKVLSLADSVISYGTFIFGGPQSNVKVGQAVGSVQVYNSLGVDPQTGDMIYEDRNKDGLFNVKDMIYVPIALPKFTGGTTLTAGYKRVTVEALFSYVVGTKIYDYYEQSLRNYDMDWFGVMPNKFDIVNSRWRKPGDVTEVPRAIVGQHGTGKTTDWNYRPSTQFVYDASYLRLRNLMVSYDLPERLLDKASIGRCKVYCSAQNLFTVTKYIGFDPEAASNSGIVSSNLPNARAMVLGIDVSF